MAARHAAGALQLLSSQIRPEIIIKRQVSETARLAVADKWATRGFFASI